MLRKTASMQQAWQASTAARSAGASSTRHGVASWQLGQPSGHGWHRSSLPVLPRGDSNCPAVWVAFSSNPTENKEVRAWLGYALIPAFLIPAYIPAFLMATTAPLSVLMGSVVPGLCRREAG